MQTIEIKGTKRADIGKVATKQLRVDGNVPCVIYGGEEVVHFYALEKDFKKIIFTPHVYLIKLNIDGKNYDCVLQDTQYHPVTDGLLHVDFLSIKQDKPVIIEIPVKLNGFAEGVKAGGKLQLEQRKLKVKALPKNLPDTLDIEISKLALGNTIQVGQLAYDNLELLNARNNFV